MSQQVLFFFVAVVFIFVSYVAKAELVINLHKYNLYFMSLSSLKRMLECKVEEPKFRGSILSYHNSRDICKEFIFYLLV